MQTAVYADYAMDEYSQGTNAVVAVISYTGYDMEDAMIINKGSYERGFGHGSMYKTAEIDLEVEEKSSARDGVKPSLRFSNIIKTDNTDQKGAIVYVKFQETLDVDGLPEEGMIIEYGDPICCLLDDNTGQHRLIKHKEIETAFVDTVRIMGTNSTLKKPSFRAVSITLRYRRNPIIGDKFSSRHGQKGTLSVLWPQENMV